jgi:hypothetical protein
LFSKAFTKESTSVDKSICGLSDIRMLVLVIDAQQRKEKYSYYNNNHVGLCRFLVY